MLTNVSYWYTIGGSSGAYWMVPKYIINFCACAIGSRYLSNFANIYSAYTQADEYPMVKCEIPPGPQSWCAGHADVAMWTLVAVGRHLWNRWNWTLKINEKSTLNWKLLWLVYNAELLGQGNFLTLFRARGGGAKRPPSGFSCAIAKCHKTFSSYLVTFPKYSLHTFQPPPPKQIGRSC